MKGKIGLVLIGILGFVGGCDFLLGIIQPNTTFVRFVNDGSFSVTVEAYYHDDQNVIEQVLPEVGEQFNTTIPAGGTRTFSANCDDLQAIQVTDADLQVLVGIGPEDSSDLLRDGDDFGCGDTITFTFDHSSILTDFAVESDVSEGGL